MRITGNTVTRRYLSNLGKNYSRLNASENKITSNSKYTRASQSPLEAARALKVRKAMSETETYQTNLNNATAIYEAAESAIMGISDLVQSTYEKLIYGANGTQDDDQNVIIAQTIETYADEMVRLMNLTVADRRIFGGVNNSANPFEIVESKNGEKTVKYNGVSISKYTDPSEYPMSKSSFLDIGIGMTVEDNKSIDYQSALPITFNGASMLGCGMGSSNTFLKLDEMQVGKTYSIDVQYGTDKKTVEFVAGATAADTAETLNKLFEKNFGAGKLSVMASTGLITRQDPDVDFAVLNTNDPDGKYLPAGIDDVSTGYANNIIQLTLDAAACLKSGDKLGAARFADKIFASQTTLSLSIADIGNQEKFIEFNQERITNNLYSLKSKQNDLEGTDLASEITNWKVLTSIYDASLQMGTSTLPKTIFDFL